MGRNLVHLVQSQIFGITGPFTFLDSSDVSKLIDSLETEVKKSDFRPDMVVGISNGGDLPALEISERLGADIAYIKINHYSLKVCGFELDEIVGFYRLAKMLGHKPRRRLIKNLPTKKVEGKRILLVDDDSYSGWTLEIAKKAIGKRFPHQVRTAVLHTYEGNRLVDYSGKLYPKREFYGAKLRFPWAKISPHYDEVQSRKSL